jgi:hypothetical protein
VPTVVKAVTLWASALCCVLHSKMAFTVEVVVGVVIATETTMKR